MRIRLRRSLQVATFFVPAGIVAACAADPGDALKGLGEAPTTGAGATSTATESTVSGTPTSQTTASAASSSGTLSATGTSSSSAQTSASSNGSTTVDASTTEAGGGGPDSSGPGPTDGAGPGPGVQCAPTTASQPTNLPTGGLPLSPANYYSGLANGGYAYPYSDGSVGAAGGTSTICQGSSGLCAAGTTGIQSAATWGAGFGVNLNQTQGSTAAGTYTVPPSATGITYALTALPAAQTVYLTIDNAGTDYYASLTALSGHVLWSAFRTTPWAPATSVALGNAPSTATHVEFQIQAETGSTSNFAFCVTSLSFQ
jgi:hypothetical protein